MTRYARPKTIDEALDLLGKGDWRLIAGGTDFYPAQGVRPIRDDVLDINGLDSLRGIRMERDSTTIGARTTWTGLSNANLPEAFNALRQAAREVGSVQIQNAGTIAGNLCNASPAADGVPPLLVLDAEVELHSADGSRCLPLHEFLIGNRRTTRLPNELMTAIRVPAHSATGRASFLKLGARKYLVISIAMVAARVVVNAAGAVATAAVAVGSCSATARRLAGLERALVGARSVSDIRDAVQSANLPELAPIDDVRGTATYRLEAAREIVSRAVASAMSFSVDATAAA